MARTKTTEGFLVMPSYTEALEEITDNPELVKEIKIAIVDYGSQGELDFNSLSPFARCYMRLIMGIIDKQKDTYRKKRDAGSQGGRGNRKQSESTDKADEKQNESTTKADAKQNESTAKADAKQDESTDKADAKQDESTENTNGDFAFGIYNNKDNNKDNNNVFVKAESKNTNTEKAINDYFAAKGLSEKVARKFINYNRDHHKGKIPTGWQDYADDWIATENAKTTSAASPDRLITYAEYQSLITQGKNKSSDFETVKQDGKTFWKLKTA